MNNYQAHYNGRIWVFWLSQLIVEVVACSDQLIHCSVKGCSGFFKGFITFLYGHNSASLRQSLYEDLVNFSLDISCTWILLGDFYIVMKPR